MARELVLLAALRLNNEIGERGYAGGERERDEDEHNAHEEGLQRTTVIADRLKHSCSLFPCFTRIAMHTTVREELVESADMSEVPRDKIVKKYCGTNASH